MRTLPPLSVRLVSRVALATGLALALAGCGGVPANRSMNSVHQPVVEKSAYTLDVTTSGGPSGLAYGEQARLVGWFEAMGLKYGDRVFIDDPAASPTTRSAVEAAAERFGVLVGGHAPQTVGYVAPGTARIVITRATAKVHGCPEWSSNSDFNPNNGLSSNFGCATNSNLAAMVANPEDLLHGDRDTGTTTAATASKAIGAYRAAAPTGKGNTVADTGSKGN